MLTEGRARILKQGNVAFYNEAQVRGNRCVLPTAAAAGATAAAFAGALFRSCACFNRADFQLRLSDTADDTRCCKLHLHSVYS